MGVDEDSDEDQVKEEVAQILSPLPRTNKSKPNNRGKSPSPEQEEDIEDDDAVNDENSNKEDQANIVAAKHMYRSIVSYESESLGCTDNSSGALCLDQRRLSNE